SYASARPRRRRCSAATSVCRATAGASSNRRSPRASARRFIRRRSSECASGTRAMRQWNSSLRTSPRSGPSSTESFRRNAATPTRPSPIVAEQPRPRAALGEDVARIAQRALPQRQTAAADAPTEIVAQLRELSDAVVELRLPPAREPLPILHGRRAVVRQLVERGLDLAERHACTLRDLDDRDAAQHVSREAALVAGVAPALDQPLRFVEMDRRDRNTAARRDLADRQYALDVRRLLRRHRRQPRS